MLWEARNLQHYFEAAPAAGRQSSWLWYIDAGSAAVPRPAGVGRRIRAAQARQAGVFLNSSNSSCHVLVMHSAWIPVSVDMNGQIASMGYAWCCTAVLSVLPRAGGATQPGLHLSIQRCWRKKAATDRHGCCLNGIDVKICPITPPVHCSRPKGAAVHVWLGALPACGKRLRGWTRWRPGYQAGVVYGPEAPRWIPHPRDSWNCSRFYLGLRCSCCALNAFKLWELFKPGGAGG